MRVWNGKIFLILDHIFLLCCMERITSKRGWARVVQGVVRGYGGGCAGGWAGGWAGELSRAWLGLARLGRAGQGWAGLGSTGRIGRPSRKNTFSVKRIFRSKIRRFATSRRARKIRLEIPYSNLCLTSLEVEIEGISWEICEIGQFSCVFMPMGGCAGVVQGGWAEVILR